MTLVGVGHALADAFAFVDEGVPATLGLHPGSYSQVADYRMRSILSVLPKTPLLAGGSAANTVKLAARLGLDAHFVGQCGHDEAARVFESELLAAGVKVRLARRDAPTGVCVTLVTAGPRRTVATNRAASGDLEVGLVGDTLLAAAGVLVIEGYLFDEPAFLDELLTRCRKANKPVSLDLCAGPPALQAAVLRRYLAEGPLRYLFLPEAEAAALTGLDAEGAVVQLAGEHATVVVRRRDRSVLVCEAGQTAAVAGSDGDAEDQAATEDGYHAGFLWAVNRGWAAPDACRAADLVARCIAERPGLPVEEPRWTRLRAELEALAVPAS